MPDGINKRSKNGQFVKSPGPGRPKGAVSARTRMMLDASGDILRSVIDQAKCGDLRAAEIILDRTVPRLKTAAEPVDMGSLPPDATLSQKANTVADAILGGRLDPVIGAQLLTALAGVARIVETDELESRIAALEGKK